MRQQGMKCADAVYRNGPKNCPAPKEDPLQRLAATKYISLYLPCCLKTAGQGVFSSLWWW